jgi:glutamine amidotransferase
MTVAILKYNSGNVRSVAFALERLGIAPLITDEVEALRSADKVIFPGVGEASSAMRYLKERNLNKVITSLQQPVLGICLGMQLLCAHSAEGDTDCLGVFDLQVRKFAEGMKVPQVGWNTIQEMKSPLFRSLKEAEYMYFVHSYYAEIGAETISTTGYGPDFSSALNKNNFYGVQFHPEKSGPAGQQLLKNFLELNP